MNDVFVSDFNNQTFNQDGYDGAILKLQYNPPSPIFQHSPVKQKVENIEVKRMRKSYIIKTLTLVDICEIVKKGEKVFRIYEGVIY